jgi:hypothetical protein
VCEKILKYTMKKKTKKKSGEEKREKQGKPDPKK